jgi:hypothetical protein
MGLGLGLVLGAAIVRRVSEAQARLSPDRIAASLLDGLGGLRRSITSATAPATGAHPLASDEAAGVWHGREGRRP